LHLPEVDFIENNVKTAAPMLVLLDRDCRFCSGLGNWLQKHPKAQEFHISDQRHWPSDCPWPAEVSKDYLVYFSRAKQWCKGDAAVLALAYDLGGVWKTLSRLARIFPSPIRRKLYLIWSKNRYRLFGKVQHCDL
jgi:predicted DCC family thiol-disulfide oxidoreductase YuxK